MKFGMKRAIELQGLALYETLSEKSPELKEMLTEYKTLLNIGG